MTLDYKPFYEYDLKTYSKFEQNIKENVYKKAFYRALNDQFDKVKFSRDNKIDYYSSEWFAMETATRVKKIIKHEKKFREFYNKYTDLCKEYNVEIWAGYAGELEITMDNTVVTELAYLDELKKIINEL